MGGDQKNNKSQSEAFVKAARALECDESEERFDAALKKVAAHKPLVEPAKKQSEKNKKK